MLPLPTGKYMKAEKLSNLFYNHRFLKVETALELKLLTEKYPWFQLGWMLYLKNLKQIESPDYQSVLKKVAVRASERKLLFHFLNSDFQKKTDKAEVEYLLPEFDGFENENGDGNSLIDKFLLSKPGAIRRNSGDESSLESENRIENAEKSITENDELTTETLASIYFQQKSYEKAMEAYKKLSLKYPEKSVYFATRIEEIEKLKNANS
jgi:tetratricopeptide (TPR) repeat protein